MRCAALILTVVFLWAVAAHADPSDLSNGVFIVHSPAVFEYSCLQTHDPCYCYGEPSYGIQSCEEQNTDAYTTQMIVWYVVAAWTEEKIWRGTEFGIGDYWPMFFIWSFGPCFPSEGLEIPSENWPGPNEGTALAVVDVPWQGNFVAVYYFEGYAYGNTGQIPLAVDPMTGFGGFANAEVPPQQFPATCYGALGCFMPGFECCPTTTVPSVCCLAGAVRYLLAESECTAMGGEWHPEWDSCGPPNPCDGGTPVEHTTWGAIKAAYR